MPTDLTDRETLESQPGHADQRVQDDYLRAHGVRPATRRWDSDPSWAPVKQRPAWLAFIVRNLRKLGLYDD